MISTVIIGENSNLSHHLLQRIPNATAISSRKIATDITVLSPLKDQNISIIFNNFQPATQLNNTDNLESYIENSIVVTAKVLEYFKNTPINKIIYTSSSSVYGNNILCNEHDELKPLNLHASLKATNEKIIEKYAHENKIDYTIARIFNMFGGNDTFSIISKILTAYSESQTLTIINNGNAIRDFIHINDVVDVYDHLLTTRNLPMINIGSGKGTSIRNILDFLKNHGVELQTQNLSREELKISTANNAIMANLLGHNTTIDVENYLLERLKKNG